MLHSDRGIQYTCDAFVNMLANNTYVTQSMSRKGNCWDNAVAESFFKLIKYEELNHHKFNTFEQLYACIQQYMKWYNTQPIHSSLAYKTPLETELEIRKKSSKIAA
jgi:transposase InsO family protein